MVWIGMGILRLEAEVGGKVPVYEKITKGRYRKNVNFVKVRAFPNPLVGQKQKLAPTLGKYIQIPIPKP